MVNAVCNCYGLLSHLHTFSLYFMSLNTIVTPEDLDLDVFGAHYFDDVGAFKVATKSSISLHSKLLFIFISIINHIFGT